MKIKRNRWVIGSALAAISLSAINVGLAALIVDSQRNGAAAQGAPKLEDSVVFAMPGGPTQTALQQCTTDDFTKKFNVRVDFLPIQPQPALARVLTQRSNPSIDVVWSLAATDHTGFKEGVFIPITSSLVPNLANLDPKFPPEPDRGALVTTAIQGIQYNTKIFKEKGLAPPTSWRDFWDPKYKGHVGIYNLAVGSGQGLLVVAGVLNGGGSQNFDAGFDYLAKLKPNLYTIFQQAPQLEAALLDGSVWLATASNGRPLSMMQQGAPVSFVQPSEGVVVSNITLSIVKGAPHPNATIAFVNWMLSNEAQSCLLQAGYPPVVKGVEVSAEMAPFMTVQRNVIPLDWVDMQERLPELLKRWSKEIDG